MSRQRCGEERNVSLKERPNRLKGKCTAALNSQHRLYAAQRQVRYSQTLMSGAPWPSYPLSMSSSNLPSPVNASMNISAQIP